MNHDTENFYILPYNRWLGKRRTNGELPLSTFPNYFNTKYVRPHSTFCNTPYIIMRSTEYCSLPSHGSVKTSQSIFRLFTRKNNGSNLLFLVSTNRDVLHKCIEQIPIQFIPNLSDCIEFEFFLDRTHTQIFKSN